MRSNQLNQQVGQDLILLEKRSEKKKGARSERNGDEKNSQNLFVEQLAFDEEQKEKKKERKRNPGCIYIYENDLKNECPQKVAIAYLKKLEYIRGFIGVLQGPEKGVLF